MPPYAEAITRHYAQRWSPPRAEVAGGPRLRDFKVLLLDRSADTSVHATVCMSQLQDPERLELFLLSRRAEAPMPQLVELLQALAQQHRGSPLSLGESVNFGRPWLPLSRCTRGLVSLPQLDGPPTEWMDVPRVRFLWLVPITEAEQRLKTMRGVEALEARFEQVAPDFLDPARASVV